MNPALLGLLVIVPIAGYLALKHFSGVLAFAGSPDTGTGEEGSSADGTSLPSPSGVAMQWNDAILAAAEQANVDPVMMKSLTAEESGFNADSINPEKDFMLDGVSYGQNDRAGRAALVAWIKEGNDPASIGLNPSCGMMQIRVSIAKQFIRGLDAWDLFDPATNFEAGSYLMRQMGDGLSYDTADAWNVGLGSNWSNGVRNEAYRAKVQNYYDKFRGDFQ